MYLRRSFPARPRGVSLVEALVSMAIMAFGMLAVVGVQGTLRYNADIAKQRAEATRLAEQELETVRAFSTVGSGGTDDLEFDAIDDREAPPITNALLNTTFTLRRDQEPAPDGTSKTISVSVTWTDRNGTTQEVRMHDVIARIDPVLSGFVRAPRPLSLIGKRQERHPTIPADAKRLGDMSIFKPPGGTGTVGWVFNNATGAITHTCTGLVVAQADLEASHVASSCTLLSTPAQLLSGDIRFNLRGATHIIGADESVIKPAASGNVAWVIDHSAVALTRACTVPTGKAGSALVPADLTGCVPLAVPVSPFSSSDGSYPLAASDSENPQWPALAAGVRLDSTVTFTGFGAATNFQCYSDSPSLAKAPVATSVKYFCIVLVNSASGWAGRTKVVPLAYTDNGATWNIGTTEGTYKVCRYTQADSDVTDNPDHPAYYAQFVVGNLINQNFLVIDGLKTCPSDSAPTPATGDLYNSNTRLHQSAP